MNYSHLNRGLLMRLFIFAVLVAGFTLSLLHKRWIFTIPVFILFVFSVWKILDYVNGINRKLAFFFDAIKNEDSTLHFPEKVKNKSLQNLHKSLNRINQAISDIKIRNEYNQRFFLEFMKHSATGLMAIDENGYIDIINARALKFCRLSQLSHLNRIAQSNKILFDALNQIRPGQSLSIKWVDGPEIQQVSLKVVELKFAEKQYRIYSLYDIRAEMEENELETWQKLIRVLTHEIMNSIAPITSLSNTLSKYYTRNGRSVAAGDITQKEVDDTIQGLAVIEERGEGLIQFVDSYRKLTKIPKPRFGPVKIKEWLRSIEWLVAKRMDEEGIDFAILFHSSKESFPADQKLLTQVIINLVNNAADALAQRKHKKIRLTLTENAEGKIKIAITDNGIGFCTEDLENIFIPFYTTKEKGSGIGLSLSRQIMRLHKGSISARSTPGVETTFEVVI